MSNRRWWCAGAVLALTWLGASAARAQPREPHVLILMAGQGPRAEEIEPMLQALCERAADGSLSSRYTDVLKIGVTVSVADVLKSMAPGEDKTAAQTVVSLLSSTLKSESTTNCTNRPLSFDKLGHAPFDVLLMGLIRDEGTRTNLRIDLVASDGTIDNTHVKVEEDAIGVALASPGEVDPFVGCVAWTAWSSQAWLGANVDCRQRYRLRRRTPDEMRLWARRSAVAAGVGVGVAVGLWVVAELKYDSLVNECSDAHRCPSGRASSARDTVRWLDRAWGTAAVIGAGLAITSTTLYVLARPKREPEAAPSLHLSVGYGSGPRLVAEGRW
jgi:hypothetical protein